ncbi:hypothetical protein C2R22_05460 [Salinigranum rubrum]|uniref:Uncharacterized protein n=1 Tax=Salinigranum rubrum TaxID=755307 RepID=A0A2I8VH08_9EURY|nr:DUF6517 family protein [Salinigranum rubrum]AUV81174.1 hypothetical protein C2R22_05460 [Salinigranum rubrum]
MRGRLLPLVALLVVVAGCTGTLAEVRSAPATIPDAALTPVGYVHGNTTEVPLTYPVGVGPVSRDVTVYVWVSGYSRTVTDESDANDTAALLVVSSPNRKVEGQSVNPFAQLSNRGVVSELFEVVAEADNATGGVIDGVSANVTDVARLEEQGVQNRTVLGQRVEVVTYAATVQVDTAAAMGAGTSTATPVVDSADENVTTRTLLVHLMAVEHGEDVVFAMGVHGDDMDESATIAALMEAIEHEAVLAES